MLVHTQVAFVDGFVQEKCERKRAEQIRTKIGPKNKNCCGDLINLKCDKITQHLKG